MSMLDSARGAFDNLNDRERKLVALLGGVFVILAVGLSSWFITGAIGDIEDENSEIRTVLRDIARAEGLLAEREAQRAAAARLYDNPAPPLGSFLEEKARAAGYERPLEVTDQPDKVAGGFSRRHVRANLPGVGLKAAMELLTAVENSGYPVAIEQLHIDHFQGGDRYNIKVGVFAFDRARASDTEEESEGGSERASKMAKSRNP